MTWNEPDRRMLTLTLIEVRYADQAANRRFRSYRLRQLLFLPRKSSDSCTLFEHASHQINLILASFFEYTRPVMIIIGSTYLMFVTEFSVLLLPNVSGSTLHATQNHLSMHHAGDLGA